jgi:hypothetical protein
MELRIFCGSVWPDPQRGLLVVVVNYVDGVGDSLLEGVVTLEDLDDVRELKNLQVDEHTSDLWNEFLGDVLLRSHSVVHEVAQELSLLI